jgi:tetratricopeptide (TPR) repeat protein
MMRQTSYQDAAETLEHSALLNCDVRVALLLAAAYDAGGDAPRAQQTLQKAHSTWPSNNSIAASLAREYLGAGQESKALDALAHFHATVQTPLQEMELGVIVYLGGHRLTSAEAVAETAYRSYPSLHTLLMLANVLQLEGRYPDVNRILGAKRESFADSPEFLITLAESEYDASIFATAREDIERAVLLDQNSYQAHYILANVLVRLNEVDRALNEYRTAIKLAPAQPRTYYQMALALRARQDESGEMKALEQTLAADDHYAPAHYELGRILMEQHRLADAARHLETAIRYNPKAEEAYYLLVRVYAGLGEKGKSDEMVKRLVTVRKENRPGAGNKDGTPPTATPTMVP